MTHEPTQQGAQIRVKVLTPVPQRYFMHQFPGGEPVWDGCRFIFDPAESNYDWLVVYEDMPGLPDVPRD